MQAIPVFLFLLELFIVNQSMRYFVYDLLGNNLLDGFLEQQQTDISIEALPSGLYVVQILGENETASFGKFLKE